MTYLRPSLIRAVSIMTLTLAPILFQSAARADDSLAVFSASAPDARVIRESCNVAIQENGKGEFVYTRRLRVFSQKGVEYCFVSIPSSDFLKTSEITGQVYDKSGVKIYTLSKKDIEHSCGFGGYALYQDYCYDHFELSAGSFPFEMEYSYKSQFLSPFFWPSWNPQGDIPVDASTYNLVIPKSVAFKMTAVGEIPQPYIASGHDGENYDWRLSDVPAFGWEKSMPAEALFKRSLHFSPTKYKLGNFSFDATSWQSLSRDYFMMARGSFETSKAQEEFVNSILMNTPGTLQDYSRFHRMLSQKSRYVQVTIGLGGWKPHTSEETFANGYGDCKDLATMYVSMLKGHGYEPHLAVALTKDDGEIDPDCPTLNRFNHMICYFVSGTDTIWHDATCFDCEFGDLPSVDENINVLAVDSANGGLVKTRSSTPEENTVVRVANFNIAEDLSLHASERIQANGNASHGLIIKSHELSERDFAEYLKFSAGLISRKLEVERSSIDREGTKFSKMKCEVEGKVPRYLRQVNGALYFDLSILPALDATLSLPLDYREYAIDLDYPKKVIDTLIITTPESLRARSIPDSVKVSSSFGSLTIAFSTEPNKVIMVRQRVSARYRIEVEEFEEFGAYRDAINKELLKSIVFERVK